MEELIKKDSVKYPDINSLLVPVMTIDRNYNILSMNDFAEKIYGSEKISVGGVNASAFKCYKVSHGYDRPCHEKGEDCPLKLLLENPGKYSAGYIHNHNGTFYSIKTFRDKTNKDVFTELHVEVSDLITEIKKLEVFKGLFYDNSMAMFILDPETTIIRDINQAAIKYYGYTRGEVVGKTLSETFDPFIPKKQISSDLTKAVYSGQKIFTGFRHRLKNGEIRDVEIGITIVYVAIKPIALMTVIDVTDKKMAEEEKGRLTIMFKERSNILSRLQKLYFSAVSAVDVLLKSEDEEKMLENLTIELSETGLFSAIGIGKPFEDGNLHYFKTSGVGAESIKSLVLPLKKIPYSIAASSFIDERINFSNDYLNDARTDSLHSFFGKEEWNSMAAVPIKRGEKVWGVMVFLSGKKYFFTNGILNLINIIGVILGRALDEIDLKNRLAREQEKAIFLASHDFLTGVPNRSVLSEAIKKAGARSKRNGSIFAIGMLDLDDFKPINDKYGHETGDQVLKIFTEKITAILRETDTLFRIGGDEFAIILEELKGIEGLYNILGRIEDEVEKPLTIGGNLVKYGLSAGFTLHMGNNTDPERLLSEADKMLYDIKNKKATREHFWKVSEIFIRGEDINDVGDVGRGR